MYLVSIIILYSGTIYLWVVLSNVSCEQYYPILWNNIFQSQLFSGTKQCILWAVLSYTQEQHICESIILWHLAVYPVSNIILYSGTIYFCGTKQCILWAILSYRVKERALCVVALGFEGEEADGLRDDGPTVVLSLQEPTTQSHHIPLITSC